MGARPRKSDPAKKRTRSRRKNESRLRALEDRMLKIETAVKRQDRHFGRLVAPIVGLAERIGAMEEHLKEQDKRQDIMVRGLDAMLKHFSVQVPGFQAPEITEG